MRIVRYLASSVWSLLGWFIDYLDARVWLLEQRRFPIGMLVMIRDEHLCSCAIHRQMRGNEIPNAWIVIGYAEDDIHLRNDFLLSLTTYCYPEELRPYARQLQHLIGVTVKGPITYATDTATSEEEE